MFRRRRSSRVLRSLPRSAGTTSPAQHRRTAGLAAALTCTRRARDRGMPSGSAELSKPSLMVGNWEMGLNTGRHPAEIGRALNSSHANISYAVFCLKKKKHTSELQSRQYLVCRLLLEKKKKQSTTEN